MCYPARLVVFACLLGGCGGGGGTTPDASPSDAAAARDTAPLPGSDGAVSAADGPTADAAPGTDAAPMSMSAAGKRLVGGRAHVLGNINHSCSQPAGAGDRWCAFSLPGPAIGQTALWVINVTKAIAGTVTCDGKDPSCIHLTDDLWAGMDPDGAFGYPTAHQFTGETLIYLGNVPAGGGFYEGPHFAWRPGWTAGKQLSAKAITCTAHLLTDAVFCLENAQPGTFSPTIDLHAGRAGTSPLPPVATIYRYTATDSLQWAATLSPLGDYIAWSGGGPTAMDPETLYLAKIDEAGMADKHVTVAKGVSQWDISGDGKRWYFERDYSYPPSNSIVPPTGTLATADFPSLANEKMIAPAVQTYFTLDQPGTFQGVGWFDGVTAGHGTFKILKDPSNPASAVVISAGASGANVSPDLRYTLIETASAKAGSEPLNDAIIVNNATMARCTLVMAPTISTSFGPTFLPGGSQLFWADAVDPTTLSAQGWMANPDGCTGKTKFSDKVDFWLVAGNQGLLFGEPAATANKWNLRAAKLGPGGAFPMSGATTVASDVDLPFGTVGSDRNFIIYGVFKGDADDGLYAYGPVGFASP
jgi:hypothetical protein